MSQLQPLKLKGKTGFLGLLVLLTAVGGFILKWKEILEFLNPAGASWLNWRFVVACIFVTALVTWLGMNQLWLKEFSSHQQTKNERDNFENLLSISEEERMTDVVTGIPNGTKLTADLDTFFSRRHPGAETQVILIDLKGFRRINRDFGFLKGDEILRMIAQEIYQSMRRNENMYRHPAPPNSTRSLWKTLYRRYPGGDEFVFLVEGDQSEAIGFVNRLVPFSSSRSARKLPSRVTYGDC
jgi:GGDEF domain-containing protein